MDYFCIQRGTLLDRPSVPTLERPDLHSVHCLIDVSVCVESDFEILMDPTDDGTMLYGRGWRLSEPAKAQAIQLAATLGVCSTCENNHSNGVSAGFRVAFTGIVQALRDADSPPTVGMVENDMQVLDIGESICGSDALGLTKSPTRSPTIQLTVAMTTVTPTNFPTETLTTSPSSTSPQSTPPTTGEEDAPPSVLPSSSTNEGVEPTSDVNTVSDIGGTSQQQQQQDSSALLQDSSSAAGKTSLALGFLVLMLWTTPIFS